MGAERSLNLGKHQLSHFPLGGSKHQIELSSEMAAEPGIPLTWDVVDPPSGETADSGVESLVGYRHKKELGPFLFNIMGMCRVLPREWVYLVPGRFGQEFRGHLGGRRLIDRVGTKCRGGKGVGG